MPVCVCVGYVLAFVESEHIDGNERRGHFHKI